MALVVAGAGVARAGEPDEAAADEATVVATPDGARRPFVTSAAPVQAQGRVGLEESQLQPAARTTQQPPHWTGDIVDYDDSLLFPKRPWDTPPFIERRILQHSRFIQPLLVTPVFPEISARLLHLGGVDPGPHRTTINQFLFLSLYAVDVYIPVITLQDDALVEAQRLRIDLKLPLVGEGPHAFSIILGGNVPVATSDASRGFRTSAGYAYGGEWLTAQVRAGFGVDRLVGEPDAELESAVFFDGAAGVHLTRHLDLLAEMDGRVNVGEGGLALRALPGVRIYPLDRATLSIGLGAFLDFEHTGDDWNWRRVGALVDVGYLFF